MTLLSAVIITKNEEANIRRCLESVKFADEIIVVDSNSTDKTTAIASEFGAKVFTREWQGFGPAKQEGVNQARGEWILSIDADEIIPVELAAEITSKISSNNGFSGYYLNRKTRFLGRWMLHSGWYPDYVLRLFQKKYGKFNTAVIHESVETSGKTDYLKNDLLHYSHPDLESYLEKFNRYTTVGAQEAYKSGKRAGWSEIIFKPQAAFLKHYITGQGFRDGLEGLILSILSSMAVLVKYAKLYVMQKKEKAN
jgi:glycosyltransferase involved in cell wall biosynthesis